MRKNKKGGFWKGVRKAVALTAAIGTFGLLASTSYVNYYSIFATKIESISNPQISSQIVIQPGETGPSFYEMIKQEDELLKQQKNFIAEQAKKINQIPVLLDNIEFAIDNSHKLKNKTYQTLDSVISSTVKPENVELTEWEEYTLSKLIAIDGFIEKYGNYYGNNILIEAQILLLESSYNPDSVGTQGEIGLGQILPRNEASLRILMGSKLSRYYCPDYDSKKSLWDPETNIIAASLAIRKKVDFIGKPDYDRAYAYYVFGNGAFNEDGTLSANALEVVASMRQRYDYIKKILPLFKFSKEEVLKIKDTRTKDLLLINLEAEDGLETYQMLADYFSKEISKQKSPTWEHALITEEYLTVSATLSGIYRKNASAHYQKIKSSLSSVKIAGNVSAELKSYYLWLDKKAGEYKS
jgi:hypothetical protein